MKYEFKVGVRFKILKLIQSERNLDLIHRLNEIGYIKIHAEDQFFLDVSYTDKAIHLIKHS